jgi:uncharacterized protein YqiB (DUF1249 family)
VSILKLNFALFAQLFEDFSQLPKSARSDVDKDRPLFFQKQSEGPDGLDVVLAQYVEHAGKRISDPKMVLRVRFDSQILEALSFEDASGLFEVNPKPHGFDARQFVTQNTFLHSWLRACVEVGHCFSVKDDH